MQTISCFIHLIRQSWRRQLHVSQKFKQKEITSQSLITAIWLFATYVWAIQAKLLPPEYNYHNYIFRKRGLVAVCSARRGAEELVPGEQNQEGVVSWQSTVWINISVRLPCLFLLITRLAPKERLRLSIAEWGRSRSVLTTASNMYIVCILPTLGAILRSIPTQTHMEHITLINPSSLLLYKYTPYGIITAGMIILYYNLLILF